MSNPGTVAPTAYVYSYKRVSSIKQSFERQTAATDAYCDAHKISIPPSRQFSDKLTGKHMDRPGLNALLEQARPGDRILVSSLDRLGRTVLGTLETMEMLENKGITVISLKEGENFEGSAGKVMRGLLLLLAEWERTMINERAAEARAAREARGAAQQRSKNVLKPEMVADVRRRHAAGDTKVQIVKDTGLSRSSVYRALRDA